MPSARSSLEGSLAFSGGIFFGHVLRGIYIWLGLDAACSYNGHINVSLRKNGKLLVLKMLAVRGAFGGDVTRDFLLVERGLQLHGHVER